MHLKYVFVCLFATSFSLNLAQETCESLIKGLQETLNRTQTLTRTTQMKAGFAQIASNTSLVKQNDGDLEVIVLERSGRQPDPNRAPANFQQQEEGWLGAMNLDDINCEGHALTTTSDSTYELELAQQTEDSPVQNLMLAHVLSSGDYILEPIHAKIRAPGLPFVANMNTTFSDWQLLD